MFHGKGATRKCPQTHNAQFYQQDAELTVNEAARLLADTHGLTLEENALLFLLTDIAVADARIAVWDAAESTVASYHHSQSQGRPW